MELSARSRRNLAGVHPDLVRVVERAAELVLGDPGFIVTEGVRTLARQKQLVSAGASKTMKSRHLTGHAVDLAATVGGRIRWDWPLYAALAHVMNAAATIENVPIVWGGAWESFRDGPHFELDRSVYPGA